MKLESHYNINKIRGFLSEDVLSVKYDLKASENDQEMPQSVLNELGKRDKMRGLLSILSLLLNEFINSIIQEH